jgi:membrane-bound inhibitor of C-type lysozyme
MRIALPLLAVAALAACATAPEEGERRIAYSCDRGPPVTVVYAGETARIESSDGSAPIVLQRRKSGSGLWYESPTRTIRSKGDEMFLTIGRMAPMTCNAVRPTPR